MKRLYFDYNASAPMAEGLADHLGPILKADYKNPSSVHAEGRGAHAAIEATRRQILTLVNAGKKDALVFTSGGTEANNTVLRSAFARRGERSRLLLTNIEHSSVRNTAFALERAGARLTWINVDRQGQIDLDDYEKNLTPAVFLVSVMLANNETGFVLPVERMAKKARALEIPFHSDAVCAMGKMPIDFASLGVDYLTFSSHKFGGLKGSGGIVVRDCTTFSPFILGGPHEAERRAGTENVLGIVSSAYALAKSLEGLPAENERQRKLRALLKTGIAQVYPRVVFTESPQNLPQTLSASFVGLNGTVLLTNLDLEGVAASYGSACASGSLEVSTVMKNLKLTMEEAQASLRLSFGQHVTEGDVHEFLLRLKTVLVRM